MNNSTQQDPIHAIIELMGHQKMAGTITDSTIGGGAFIRVDVPETSISPTFTRFLNPSSIYAINPVTEDVMRVMAERFKFRPIDAWDVEGVYTKVLALQEKSTQTWQEQDGDD